MARSLEGHTFRTESGLRFRVVADRFFAAGSHDRQNSAYLDSLREGYLVSVFYHSVPTPLVTLKDGVAKLVEVDAAGLRVKGAGKISSLLGVAKTRHPVKLERA